MTYLDAAKVMGKRACAIVQLNMSRCAHQFGVAPCTASGIGNSKCFRTRSSCKDPANYSETQLGVYNFATTRVTGFQQNDQSPVFPTITGIDTAPTILDPGKGLGSRASISITIQDHPWTDVYSDPYRADRTTDADRVGTFWGKFLARNRFHENRKITVYTGFLNDDNSYSASNFQTRTYFITNISGPSANGSVTITAKDPIKFADGDKSKFPYAYRLKLTADISSSATSIQVIDVAGLLTSSGPILTGSQPYIRIDNEIMKVTAVSPSLGAGIVDQVYTLTVVRGNSASAIPSYYQASTNIGANHSLGASVQPCYEWNNVYAADVIYSLLVFAGVDPSYIESAATWQADFVASGLGDYRFTNLACKSESIKNLLDEIAAHNILIWWDERAQKIKCRALVYRSVLNKLPIGEQSHIIQQSQNVAEVAKDRVTQVWLSYNVINPTYDLSKQVSYEAIDIVVDLSLETAAKYGKSAISTMFSRWLENGSSIAPQVSARRLQRYQDSYHVFTFTVDAKDAKYWTGDNVRVQSALLQDEFGVAKKVNYLITQADEVITSNGISYKYTAIEQTTYSGRTAVWTPTPGATIPGGLPDEGEVMATSYNTASLDQQETYVFWGYPVGQFADGNASYVWI